MKNNQLEINNRNIWKVWEKFYEDYPEEKKCPEPKFRLKHDDHEYCFFRTRDEALKYYANEMAKINVNLDRHKVSEVADEALDKFPEVFI